MMHQTLAHFRGNYHWSEILNVMSGTMWSSSRLSSQGEESLSTSNSTGDNFELLESACPSVWSFAPSSSSAPGVVGWMNTFDVGRKQLTDKPIIPVVDTRYLNLNLVFILVLVHLLIIVLVLNLVIFNLLCLILTFIIPVLDTRYLKQNHVLILVLFLLHIFDHPHVQH